MAFPAVTNVDGSNPGPVSSTTPDTVLSAVGNIWKVGVFSITLSPSSVAPNTAAEQTFASTGIGLLTTDLVVVQKPTSQAGLVMGGTRVSATDTLAINFGNLTAATITPTASEVYTVGVWRVQPNWSKPASGNQLDW
ncbi:MAG TPA: hypothetical protein VMV81_05735 [Phycisphaerae bacterium]|nr:hypothetical protein [Phycisphaerae bacterium]